MRRRLALLPLLLVLPACGGDVTSLDPIAQAADRTRGVASVRFEMSMTVDEEGQGTLAFRGSGAIADHGRRMQMTMTVPARDLDPEAGGGSVEIEMIAADDSFYFRGGPFDELSLGKGWLKLRDDAPFPELGQNDPAQMLEYLRATSELEELGTARIRGVETTHYAARVQLAKVAERISPQAKRQVERALEEAGSRGIEEIPVDVWVGDDGYVRRLAMDWSVNGSGIVMTMDLFDFGADVDVQLPPASDVLDLGAIGEDG